jgi:hypothetical protein
MTASVYWYICARAAYPSPIPVAAGDQREFNRRSANAIAGLSKSRHGVGDLLARPIVKAIGDHLLCDGSAVGRTDFPQLFAEIGTEWGVGNGTTTFNLPNLIGTDLPVPATAPPQVIEDGSVSTGETIVEPVSPGETGGTTGGNVNPGKRYRGEVALP